MNLTNILKRFAYLILVVVTVVLLPARAAAWGSKGHAIIARIATDRLSPSARQAIAELLGKVETLESVSGWADTIKPKRRDTANWHHVDIPLSRSHYDASLDCANECVIMAIEQQIQVLKDGKRSASDHGEALKFLVHLLGDLHQPFHVTTNTEPSDNGANKVKVYAIGGRATSLHAIWDDDLVNYAVGDSPLEAYAAELGMRQKSRGQNTLASTQGSVTEWALEAHRLAWVGYVPTAEGYFMLNDGKVWKLDEFYYDKNRPLMETQLLRAGIRLAKILNDLFGAKAA